MTTRDMEEQQLKNLLQAIKEQNIQKILTVSQEEIEEQMRTRKYQHFKQIMSSQNEIKK